MYVMYVIYVTYVCYVCYVSVRGSMVGSVTGSMV